MHMPLVFDPKAMVEVRRVVGLAFLHLIEGAMLSSLICKIVVVNAAPDVRPQGHGRGEEGGAKLHSCVVIDW
jgi:hypothetical protein